MVRTSCWNNISQPFNRIKCYHAKSVVQSGIYGIIIAETIHLKSRFRFWNVTVFGNESDM